MSVSRSANNMGNKITNLQFTIATEEMYQKAISEIEDYAIIFLNPEGIITTWNKGAEKIKGYSAEEIIGKHFTNISSKLWESKSYFNEEDTLFTDLLYRS